MYSCSDDSYLSPVNGRPGCRILLQSHLCPSLPSFSRTILGLASSQGWSPKNSFRNRSSSYVTGCGLNILLGFRVRPFILGSWSWKGRVRVIISDGGTAPMVVYQGGACVMLFDSKRSDAFWYTRAGLKLSPLILMNRKHLQKTISAASLYLGTRKVTYTSHAAWKRCGDEIVELMGFILALGAFGKSRPTQDLHFWSIVQGPLDLCTTAKQERLQASELINIAILASTCLKAHVLLLQLLLEERNLRLEASTSPSPHVLVSK